MGWWGWPCDFSVRPSPNWTTWFFTALGVGLGLGLGALGSGLTIYYVTKVQVQIPGAPIPSSPQVPKSPNWQVWVPSPKSQIPSPKYQVLIEGNLIEGLVCIPFLLLLTTRDFSLFDEIGIFLGILQRNCHWLKYQFRQTGKSHKYYLNFYRVSFKQKFRNITNLFLGRPLGILKNYISFQKFSLDQKFEIVRNAFRRNHPSHNTT